MDGMARNVCTNKDRGWKADRHDRKHADKDSQDNERRSNPTSSPFNFSSLYCYIWLSYSIYIDNYVFFGAKKAPLVSS